MSLSLAKSILCTIGPSSWDESILKRLEDLGVSLFRINLSHTRIEDLPGVIEHIQRVSNVPICLDSEGAQIRTASFKNSKVVLTANSIVDIPLIAVEGGVDCFNLYPLDIAKSFEIGDLITIDFHAVLAQVIDKDDRGVRLRVLTGGTVGQNKAVSIDREIHMPPLTSKDIQAMAIGQKYGIHHVALSFANSAQDVRHMRKIAGEGIELIAKIESLTGLRNLEEIASEADALLIDRGDLSRQVPIEQIPRVQKDIIRRTKLSGKRVFVATNLLESMITSPGPTRAEVNDVFNTLTDGADGLVLAAETAIGAHPVQSVMMVAKMINQYTDFISGLSVDVALKQRESLLLALPNGGHLVQSFDFSPDWKNLEKLMSINVNRCVLLDAQQIALGVFSPLDGFMDKVQLESVLNEYRLPSGDVWPLPILMSVTQQEAVKLSKGQSVILKNEEDHLSYACLKIKEIFKYDLSNLCQRMFGTKDLSHPGVKQMMGSSGIFVAGSVKLLRRIPSAAGAYELTPRQTRAIFEYKGWSRIVAFHTRNVIHRAHEYIQLQAIQRYHCDGIFIHPVIGPKKTGDYQDIIILKSYELAIQRFYPKDSVLLGAFPAYARYCGPREAVFTAICRKNYGCSHFIVGRDHTGVGNFYKPRDSQELFEKLGDIGITPIFFDQVYYCPHCKDYVSKCSHGLEEALHISGTQSREILSSGQMPPEWFMRKEIAQIIFDYQKDKKEVFVP